MIARFVIRMAWFWRTMPSLTVFAIVAGQVGTSRSRAAAKQIPITFRNVFLFIMVLPLIKSR